MQTWDRSRVMAFDFETAGTDEEYQLQPWRVAQKKAWASSLVVSWYEGDRIVDTGGLDPTVDDMRGFLQRAIDTQSYVVGWNTPFDIAWLLAYGLEHEVFRVKFLDGMLFWRHATIEPEYDTIAKKRKSYGLKACVEELFPNEPKYNEGISFTDTSPEAREKLHAYNIKDVHFTLKCAEHWYNKLDPLQRRAALIEAESLPMIARANLYGMPVDEFAAKELKSYLQKTAQDAYARLAPHGVTEEELRSPKQLSEVLFTKWSLESTEKTKTGKSTSKSVLHTLAKTDPRAADIRAYREALNNCTKFADTPLQSLEYNEDGRAHPLARVYGTYSGRLTYDSKQGRGVGTRQIGFAIHQEKRSPEFRRIITPPDGYTLVEFDAAGQEFRWMAIASGDDTMLSLCQPGADPHCYMGAKISGKTYEGLKTLIDNGDKSAKDLRQLGKVANLSLQYRTSAKRLMQLADVQYGIELDLTQAKHIHETYRTSYPRIKNYWKLQAHLVEAQGYAETFAGRRVHVTGDWAQDSVERWLLESTAINFRIQGTGADQKYLALKILKDHLVHIGGYFAWDLHDGIYMYIPDDKVDKQMPVLQTLLNNLPYHKAWSLSVPIPLHWDGKYGKSWGAMKEFKYDY